MTIETNKALIHRYIDELNHRNTAIIDVLVAEDFRPAVWQGYSRNITAFPDYVVRIEEMIAEGDKVVVVWNHQGTHLGDYDGTPPSGKVVVGRAISIYQIVDNMIVGADGAWNQVPSWQHLGLTPDLRPLLSNQQS